MSTSEKSSPKQGDLSGGAQGNTDEGPRANKSFLLGPPGPPGSLACMRAAFFSPLDLFGQLKPGPPHGVTVAWSLPPTGALSDHMHLSVPKS